MAPHAKFQAAFPDFRKWAACQPREAEQLQEEGEKLPVHGGGERQTAQEETSAASLGEAEQLQEEGAKLPVHRGGEHQTAQEATRAASLAGPKEQLGNWGNGLGAELHGGAERLHAHQGATAAVTR
jgi:hypothetical protein